jgi:ferric-dicitrate binding protein FerR (iron transport regulator)
MEKNNLIDLAVESCYENDRKIKEVLKNKIEQDHNNEEIAKILKSLNQSKSKSIKANSLEHDFSRILEKIENEKSKPIVFNILKYVAVLVIALFATIYLLIFDNSQYSEYLTASNQTSTVKLLDNSEVEICENSVLRVNNDFNLTGREVEFNGQAFFDITKSEISPFTILTNCCEVQVLGTKFSLNSKNKNGKFSILLQEGSVKLNFFKLDRDIYIKPGEKVVYNEKKNKIKRFKISDRISFDIKSQSISFINESLKEVVKSLNIIYNKKIRVRNKELLNVRISGTYKQHNVDDILSSVKLLLEFKTVKRKSGVIEIY